MSLHCQCSETVKINETLGDNALEKSMHHQIKITKSKILHNSHLIFYPQPLHCLKIQAKLEAARSARLVLFSIAVKGYLFLSKAGYKLFKRGQECCLT